MEVSFFYRNSPIYMRTAAPVGHSRLIVIILNVKLINPFVIMIILMRNIFYRDLHCDFRIQITLFSTLTGN